MRLTRARLIGVLGLTWPMTGHGGTAAAQRATALDDVAKAMGGKERVLAVRSLIVEGTGERLFFDQALSPYAKTNNTLTAFSPLV